MVARMYPYPDCQTTTKGLVMLFKGTSVRAADGTEKSKSVYPHSVTKCRKSTKTTQSHLALNTLVGPKLTTLGVVVTTYVESKCRYLCDIK